MKFTDMRVKTKPMLGFALLAKAVAACDPSSTIVVDRRDGTGKPLAAPSRVNGSLVRVVAQVRRMTRHSFA